MAKKTPLGFSLALAALSILACACASRSKPAVEPTTRPPSAPTELVGQRFALEGKAKVARALVARLKATVKLELELSKKDKGGKHWILVLVGAKRGAARERPEPKKDADGEEVMDRTCSCKYEPLIEEGYVHVAALRKSALGWVVVGHYAPEALGAGNCKISADASFGDRNNNGAPDVVVEISEVDDGCRAVGDEWTRKRSLWEFGPRAFVKQLDLGEIEGMSTRPSGGQEFFFFGDEGQPPRVVIADAEDDPELTLEVCVEGELDGQALAGGQAKSCKQRLSSAKRYHWSANKKRWVPDEKAPSRKAPSRKTPSKKVPAK